ncbi:MAG: hypothetical protein B7Y56_03240 [Gallionellales bacterium 35-53-114]|nr:MAG: hypothetical protein B7Y56_03240 [Gallionellales bacterium 35-53-114]OYZ65120.1 MAG: hypothetical protein B7Y04_00400 [Gallionellales bacterium 24-53-125]OZB08028.1 MAG: hypothetical protein B7X61_10850 [Gallionellales bacterium 39-52-133]
MGEVMYSKGCLFGCSAAQSLVRVAVKLGDILRTIINIQHSEAVEYLSAIEGHNGLSQINSYFVFFI